MDLRTLMKYYGTNDAGFAPNGEIVINDFINNGLQEKNDDLNSYVGEIVPGCFSPVPGNPAPAYGQNGISRGADRLFHTVPFYDGGSCGLYRVRGLRVFYCNRIALQHLFNMIALNIIKV